jgi:hypothetical protein
MLGERGKFQKVMRGWIRKCMDKSDERFGSYVEINPDCPDDPLPNHWPNRDVSISMWMKMQEGDKLPFLPIFMFD